jgi:endonuclease/exonuclease/phosphatase (EEP) superfamily protein YafD
MKFFRYLLIIVAALLLAAVLVSLFPSDKWFIRTVDLVREPMSWAALILLVVSALALRGRARLAAIAMFGLAIVINLWRIWPYVPLAGTQLALDETSDDALCFEALAVNVKVKNEGYAEIARQIEAVDPDVLFLMETDEKWIDQLEPALAGYPTVRRHPQPHAFGLVFASRIPLSRLNVIENTHRDTPTVYATLMVDGARPVEFIGLHPKPPLPRWNTEERDENIVNAGKQTPDRLPDALVMGDFNDVPWSRTTGKFREQGDWKDPRIGRGAFPTFPANKLWLGWPLDQLMVKGDMTVRDFEVMPDNGSDHRAMRGEFCVPARGATGQAEASAS